MRIYLIIFSIFIKKLYIYEYTISIYFTFNNILYIYEYTRYLLTYTIFN